MKMEQQKIINAIGVLNATIPNLVAAGKNTELNLVIAKLIELVNKIHAD